MSLLISTTAFASAFRCNLAELIPGRPADFVTSEEKGADSVQKKYETLRDPEKTLGVNLKTLAEDLGRELSPADLRGLTTDFHDVLELAAKGKDGKPNPFARDNVAHVALHYRDLENSRADLDGFFGAPDQKHSPTDLALLNASAHDIGKIAELVGMVSPEVLGIYNAAVADSPQAAFFLKTILGHDGLSMEGIENLVKRFGAAKDWTAAKVERVTHLLQAASARHNAGYAKLENDKDSGVFHFWQTSFPQFAAKMRAQGIYVSDTYPAATGGWMPALLAMVDRGTSLHPSFVEKIAGQGNFEWSGKSVGSLLKGNARSVRQEIDSIALELGKHVAGGKKIQDFPLYIEYQERAATAERLGFEITEMNDFSRAYEGRPSVPESEQTDFVYYKKPKGDWYRVQKSGLLQKFDGTAWHIQGVDGSLSAATLLMREVIGYPPIDASGPRLSGPRLSVR